jgi:hypothetical protein
MRRRTLATARARGLRGFAALLLLGCGGCILPSGGGRVSGRPLGDHRQLVPGVTKKAELFEWLGAPMAIAGPGEYVEVPAANVDHHDDLSGKRAWFGGGSWSQQGDAWMELFAVRQPIGPAHRVYYWYSTARGGLFVWPVFFIVERNAESMAELWVLVDEERGVATDFVYWER